MPSLEVRREAIEERIAETRDNIRNQTEQDRICSELEEIVALRQYELESGRDARIELVNARIAVAERQEMVRQQNGGAQVDAWTNELSDMAIEIASIEGSQRFTWSQLSRVRNVQPLAEEFAECQRELEIAEYQYNQARQEVAEMQARIDRLAAPVVVILSGD
ncbi:MAG: hypothetical protein JW936_00955 [Sedimentisphaerales bacterium]|nr:hypothetical protein [Sedimentisphaerales bacterium]